MLSRHTPSFLLCLSLVIGITACNSSAPKADKGRQLEIFRETAEGYYTMGEYQRAKEQAAKGLELSPNDESLLLVLGRCMLVTGLRAEVGGAEKIFRRLLAKDDFRPHLGLAIALERKGMFYAEAADEIGSGERYTDAPDPAKRAVERRQEGVDCWEEAIDHYETVVRLAPSERDALNGLLRTYSLLGRDEKALSYARGLLDVIGADMAFWHRQLERPDLRVEDEQLYRLRTAELEDLTVLTRMSAYTLLTRLGRRDEALVELDAALLLEPDSAEFYGRRGELFLELGEYQSAIDDLDRFLSLSQVDFEHPSIQLAFKLRSLAEANLTR